MELGYALKIIYAIPKNIIILNKMMNYKVGDSYSMKDFESFSLNPLVSLDFLGDDFCCLLRIKVSVKDSEKLECLCIHDIVKHYNKESEVLLIKQKLTVSNIWKLEHPKNSEYHNIRVIDLKL